MFRLHPNQFLPATLLLAALLIGAQSAALLHAFKHDPGALQGQSCTTCVAAAQLGHGCVDTQSGEPVLPCRMVLHADVDTHVGAFSAPLPRQRGPPASS